MNVFVSPTVEGCLLVFVEVFWGLVIFWLGQRLYQLMFRRTDLNKELFIRDNVAAAVALCGFFFGVLVSLDGVLAELPAAGVEAVPSMLAHGGAVIVFMLLGAFIGDRLILRRCDCFRQIFKERNLGAGFAEGGVHVANGLVVSSALAGDSGTWIVGAACWIAAMLIMVGAAAFYPLVARFDVFGEIRNRNNAAAGLALAGFLIGIGNILRISLAGDFSGWQTSLPQYGLTLIFCILLMAFVRWFADLILVPGVSLSAEIAEQAIPNIGAGLIEAFCYIAASYLIALAFPT